MAPHFFIFWTLRRPVFISVGERVLLGLQLEVTEWGWKKLKLVKVIKAFLAGRSHKLVAQQYVMDSCWVFWDKLVSVQVVRRSTITTETWPWLWNQLGPSVPAQLLQGSLFCPAHSTGWWPCPTLVARVPFPSWALCWALSRGQPEPWSCRNLPGLCLASALLEPARAACGGIRQSSQPIWPDGLF